MSGRETVQTLLRLITSSAEAAVAEYEAHGRDVPSLASTDVHPMDEAEDAVQLRKAIRVLEGACEQLCSMLAPPAHTIINRSQALDWACLNVAIQARVADVLADKPDGLDIEELSRAVNIHAGKLSHIMQLLATENIFTEVRPNVFANNRLSVYLQSTNGIASLAYCQSRYGPVAAAELFKNLTHPETGPSYSPNTSPYMTAVRNDGIEGTFFNWLIANPTERAKFGKAMVGLGNVMNSLSILHHYPWDQYSTVCDVGSGVGAFSVPLAKAFPNLKITLFDLEETIGQAKEHWRREVPEAIEQDRVTFVGGSFFEEIPAKNQDVYYLRNIIHNWPDAQAETIYRTVRKAMGPNSRLLIHDYVLPHTKQTKLEADQIELAPSPLLPNFGAGAIRTYNQDITMLLTYNSKERTLDESAAFASSFGLRLVKVWDLAEASVLEFCLNEA
ncbi:S-adenosyl-L-methionine-dependent methyltransferase [Moniliophthora roreri]|uniref:Uncharacterized protein n=1 Tax=Moniliophthora roreri TaxID=221103 RepID=A0A0W0G794_MONRR|nr:S-adenosyl-L-methionine-dependent methyltransferase [Moniliophthora roreri]